MFFSTKHRNYFLYSTGHRTELDEPEDLLVLPRPKLREEWIPFHLDRADNCQ